MTNKAIIHYTDELRQNPLAHLRLTFSLQRPDALGLDENLIRQRLC